MGWMEQLGNIGDGFGSDLIGAYFDYRGYKEAMNKLNGANNWLTEHAESNPYNIDGAGGTFNFRGGQFGGGSESAGADMFRQLLMSQGANQMMGGLFNNQQFQDAFQGTDLAGAMGNANDWNNAMMDPSQFSSMQQAQDLFSRAGQNFQSAGDVSGLVNQNLDAMRNLAQPFEQDMVNKFENSEFMKTRGATSGAFSRQSDLQDNLLRADSQRVLGAQGLGQQQQQFLQGLGTQQMGLGMQGYNNNFNRMLQSLQTNRQGAQSRLGNAMGMFNMGDSLFGNAFGRGLQAQEGMLGQDANFNDMIIRLLTADNQRIGAQSGFASDIQRNAEVRASEAKDFFGGVAGGFGF